MTLKEFDVQIALGLIPYTFTSERLQNDIDYEMRLTLELGDEKYSSQDYPWMKKLLNFTAFHYQVYANTKSEIVRSALIEEGILK